MDRLIESIDVNNNILIVTPNRGFQNRYLKDVFRATYDTNIHLEELDFCLQSIPFILSVISLVWESGQTYSIQAMDSELFQALKTIKKVYEIFYPKVKWNGELVAHTLISNHLEKRNELLTRVSHKYSSQIGQSIFSDVQEPFEGREGGGRLNLSRMALKTDGSTDAMVRPKAGEKCGLMGLAFSGGLDSTYTSLAYYPLRQLLITFFGFSQEIKKNQWSLVKQRCREFATQYGHFNSFVESNFREFIDYSKLHEKYPSMVHWREYCQEAISMAGLSAPILILKQVSTFLISSSFSWKCTLPWGSHPYIDNNIRFSGIRIKNYTPDLNRQEKIQNLIDLCGINSFSRPVLYVCNKSKSGTMPCCKCMKCLMVANGILSEGENPKDFGFLCSSMSIKFKTKKMFRESKIKNFYEGEVWQLIQKSVEKRKKILKRDRRYWLWFCSLDFASYTIYPNKYSGVHIDNKKYMCFLNRDETYG